MKTKKGISLKTLSLFLAIAMSFAIAGGYVGMRVQASAEGESATGYETIYSTGNPIPEIAENVRPSIVQVITSTASWNPQNRQVSTQETGSASGSYIQKLDSGIGGYILTNNHVVESAESIEIVWLDGTRMQAELVGADSGTDIAVLKFSDPAPADATPVPLGDSDELRIGELAIVIGNPGAGDSVLFGTVTAGIISGLAREEINANNFSRSTSVIQVDAAINTGNSGGALLNSKGELVGIPTLKILYSSSSIYEGLGFCIPINTIKALIDEIVTTGKVVRPRMGVGVSDFDGPDEPVASWPPAGIQIISIEEGSPADVAGLQVGDVIAEIDDVRVKSYSELTVQIDKHTAGDTVKLKVYRYYDETGKRIGKYEELNLDVRLEVLD